MSDEPKDTESMVERVARAMCDAGYHKLPETDGYNDRTQKRAWRVMARAAISEMREPTEAMVKSGGNGQTIYARGRRRCIYKNMIDAALAGGHP